MIDSDGYQKWWNIALECLVFNINIRFFVLKKRDSHSLAHKRTKWKFFAYSVAYCTFPTVRESTCFELCFRKASFWSTTDISITESDQQSTFWKVSRCEISDWEFKQKKLKKSWLTLDRMAKLKNALETEKSNDDILPCFPVSLIYFKLWNVSFINKKTPRY